MGAIDLLDEPASAPSRDILIVDDVPANIVAMEAALEPLARRVVTASSGPEALAKILNEDFAVILLDVQMPTMDGFETARLIRSRERTRHTPIIFVTAHDPDKTTMLRGYALGAVDFLFKPLHVEVLQAKTRVLVELADAHQHALQQERRAAHSKRPQLASRPLRVIVIEDDDDIRELTAELLATQGHHVVTASNGARGVELLCSHRADVALVDVGLPDLDGCEVARLFRERCPGSKTRLIATTGHTQHADRHRTTAAGFDVHLSKPVKLSLLLAALPRADG